MRTPVNAFKRALAEGRVQIGLWVGLAAGVLNHPANGVAWLANKIAVYGEQLNAGDVVLAGSFTRPTGAQRGDNLHADYGPLGSVSFRFV